MGYNMDERIEDLMLSDIIQLQKDKYSTHIRY